MSERLKELRKMLGLTQQEFADRLGIKRNAVTNYEVGRNAPADMVVSLICREFNVSEEWLRTGKGEPFAKKSRDQEIREYVDRIQGVNETFKAQFAAALSALEEEDWKIILDVVNDIKKKSMGRKQRKSAEPVPAAVTDLTPEEQEVIRQLREKKKQADESGALQSDISSAV